MDNYSALSYLDRLRLIHGNEKLKTEFHQIAQKNRQNAVVLINDMRLQFYTLYILLPEIRTLHLLDKMNSRNIIAMDNYSKILRDVKLNAEINKLRLKQGKKKNHQVLKWIFNTGAYYDGINNDFDALIDGVVSLLIQTYQDKSVLEQTAELIFSRNRKGLLIHDLSWAYFQSQDPYTLKIVAKYLLSQDRKDVQLAHNLLGTNTIKSMKLSSSSYTQYFSYMSWLRENYSFLYFTGESFQFSSKPTPYRIDLGSKYLCKNFKKEEIPSSQTENEKLKSYNKLKNEQKERLANFSYMLYQKDKKVWKDWIQKPVDQQIETYSSRLGGEIK